MNISRQNIITSLVVLGLVGFVVIFSMLVFLPRSLRLDEAQSLWQTGRSLGAMYQVLLRDVHVPLYHTLLHFWTQLLGNNVVIARTLSLILFALTIPIVYLLARQVVARNAALLATAMFAFSPFMNWYGSEVRMYSLLVLMVVLSQYFYLQILKTNDNFAWLGYVLVSIAGAYSHYFFIFHVCTQVIFYLLRRQYFSKDAFVRFMLAGALVALAFGPWIMSFVRTGAAGNSQPLLPEPTASELLASYFKYLFGFYSDTLNALVVAMWPILIVLIFFLLLRKTFVASIEVQYLFLSALLPVIIVFLISITVTPVYLPRYLIIVLPALCVCVAWYISSYPPKLAIAFGMVTLASVLFSLIYQSMITNIPLEEDYRSVVNYLEEKSDIQDVILISAPFTVYPIEYYYRKPTSLITLPVWDRYQPGGIPQFEKDELAEEVKRVTDGHRSAWLVLSYDQGYEKDIEEFFGNNFELLEKQDFSPGLTLYHYQLYNFGT